MIVRAKSPFRISFGGGGTDVPPYPEEKGGVALNVTISKYAYCTLIPRRDEIAEITSLDYNTTVRYSVKDEPLYDGNLDMAKAVAKVLGINEGFSLFLHSDIPPASGLGSSSTVAVGLVGVFARWQRMPLSPYEIAKTAWYAERVELKMPGGRQDQYAATFGGFNFMEFLKDTTIVNPLKIRPDVLNELEYRLILCDTGRRRLSEGIIDDQTRRYVQGEGDTRRGYDETKELAFRMKNALLLGEVDSLGHLLHEAWQSKKRFSPKITAPVIDEMYEEARKNGALGGKLLGAGGGGYLLFLCEFDKRHKVAESLEKMGGRVMDFAFESGGLQTWIVNKEG